MAGRWRGFDHLINWDMLMKADTSVGGNLKKELERLLLRWDELIVAMDMMKVIKWR